MAHKLSFPFDKVLLYAIIKKEMHHCVSKEKKLSVREDQLLKHIALTSGGVLEEEWDVDRLARSWVGAVNAQYLSLSKNLKSLLRRVWWHITWLFRPNGQAWWWLTLAVFGLAAYLIYK